jgi:predicted transposase YbfD/YdcC
MFNLTEQVESGKFKSLFINLNYKLLQSAINSWCLQIFDILGLQTVAIDGKSLNGYIENTGTPEGNTIYSVSAYCHQIGMVLSQIELECSKGGEGEKFRTLIPNIQSSVNILTGDALHYNSVTIQAVLAVKKDYIFNCKQKRLLESIQKQGNKIDNYTEYDKLNQIRRQVTVYKLPSDFKVIKKYQHQAKKQIVNNTTISWENCNIRSHIQVTYYHRDKLITNNYISSLTKSAIQFNKLIKGHWSIENGLHWNKDVVYKEDKHRTKDINSSHFLSICFSFVISIFHFHQYSSIEKATLKFCNRVAESLDLLGIPKASFGKFTLGS